VKYLLRKCKKANFISHRAKRDISQFLPGNYFTFGIAEYFTFSEHLGHCNTEITSNIYVQIFKEYKAKMAESIEHDLL